MNRNGGNVGVLMNLDERVYCLLNPLDSGRIDAVGVRLLDRADYLVGVYLFWNNFSNPRSFLNGIVRDFGEARLYAIQGNCPPGLLCKMSIDVPNFLLLSEKMQNYARLQLDLLEIRASNPKPFLALHYDFKTRIWDYKAVPSLACIDSNYSYVPN